jgi:hypothetical protein
MGDGDSQGWMDDHFEVFPHMVLGRNIGRYVCKEFLYGDK